MSASEATSEIHNEHDQIAKLALGELLDPFGAVHLELEIRPNPPQRVDASFTPCLLPPPDEWPSYLRLLLRMVPRPCHLEPFSSTPGYFSVRQCLRKQFEVHFQLAQMDPPRLTRDLPPLVWIFSPGRPESALRRLGAAAAVDWPPGFYLCAEGWALGFVVLRELPRTRDTLVLRLLGPRPMREAAMAEIQELPGDDPDHRALSRLLSALRRLVGRDKKVPEDERRSFMTAAMAEVLREEEELLQKGRRQGMKEGRVRGLCEALGIELTAEREGALAALDEAGLDVLFARLKTERRWP
jgi:hypothetical protein